MVITAFAAALFGGILSPLISHGLSRMADFEIEWPEFNRKKLSSKSEKLLDKPDFPNDNYCVGSKKKNKSKASNKARELEEPQFSWLDALESVNSVLESARTKVGS